VGDPTGREDADVESGRLCWASGGRVPELLVEANPLISLSLSELIYKCYFSLNFLRGSLKYILFLGEKKSL
jgi:hypothetical protein